MRPARPNHPVLIAAWVYRSALRLFPKDFRRDCGPAASSVFVELATERWQARGGPALVALLLAALHDLLRHALAERWSSWSGRPLSLVATSPLAGSQARRFPMSAFANDLQSALRAALRTPGHTLTVAVTLALGMGAALTIFAVVYGVLLRPLPFAGSERVVQLCEVSLKTAGSCSASAVNVGDIARLASLLEEAGVARGESMTVNDPGGRFSARGAVVTPGFFRAIALPVATGRLFDDDDLTPGRNQVAVVSDAFWRSRLGGTSDVLGRTLAMDGVEVRVVGVLRPDAYVPVLTGIDVWRPLTASIDDVTNRGWRGFIALARARSGEPLDAVVTEVEALHGQLRVRYPEANDGWSIQVEGLRERLVRPVRQTLWTFQAAGLLILLIACANVAGLLLVRGARRSAEFAIRSALGAGRARLVRQLLFEGLVVSAAGSLGALALAAFGARLLVQLAPAGLPRMTDVAVDWPVAAAATALATLTTILCGLVPVAGRSTGRPSGALRAQRAGAGRRLQTAFVVAQLALAVTLVFSAGLVVRALERVSVWEPGFDRRMVSAAWLLAPPDRFESPDRAVAALLQARAVAERVPGVRSAGLVSAGPLFGGEETGELRHTDDGDSGRTVAWFDADEGYLGTLGVHPIAGRLIEATDTGASPQVAVVNDTLSRQVFGAGSALGRRVTVNGYTAEIVGVVPSLMPSRPDAPPRPEIYWPIRQYRRFAAYLVLRTAPGVAGVDAEIRRRLASDVPDVQIFSTQSIETLFARTLAEPRFNSWLIGLFAAVALVLSAIGLFGAIAFAVQSRAREIGVRMALGATPRGMAAGVVTRTLLISGLGTVAGLALAVPLSAWLSALLYGLPAFDPVVLATTITSCLLVSILAGYLPARRASRVDPVRVLRAE